MAKKIHNLQQTKGYFQLSGKVKGTNSDRFYKEITTKSGKPMRVVEFGVNYDKEDNTEFTRYVKLTGFPKDDVYASKVNAAKDDPNKTEKFSWGQRHNIDTKKYHVIGVNVGLEKVINEKGDTVNKKEYLVEYDACGKINDELKENSDIFVRGNIDVSSNVDEEGNKHKKVDLIPNQVSLLTRTLDFDNENFEPTNDFEQTIVFKSIEQEKNDKDLPTGRFKVIGLIVGYSSIEEMEFYIDDETFKSIHFNLKAKDLANTFRRGLNPYWSIRVSGKLVTIKDTEEVETSDIWGAVSKMQRVKSPTRYEFHITGADPRTIEKGLYTEALIAEAKEAISRKNSVEKDFGKVEDAFAEGVSDSWGAVSSWDDEPVW